MFTGIIEELGTVLSIEQRQSGMKVKYQAETVLESTVIGDSICVNGICQTVTSLNEESFSTDISEETLKKTTAGTMHAGEKVNLERALRLDRPLGGHLVQGHVNGTGRVTGIKKTGEMYKITLSLPPGLMKYLIDEGSVAIDGISLTAARVDRSRNQLSLQIIPLTYKETVLSCRRIGDKVNIETDIIGRYVETLLKSDNRKETSQLMKWGF
jgi:riboflavin synthase